MVTCTHGHGFWDMATLWHRYHHSCTPGQHRRPALHRCLPAPEGDGNTQQGSGFPWCPQGHPPVLQPLTLAQTGQEPTGRAARGAHLLYMLRKS